MPTDYLITIGLEVHCQVKTRTKMFCACKTEFGAEPNTNTCPVCLGMPGAMPVLNREAIEKTILAGMLLGCTTPEISTWDRKNYFYPDMPKDYQLTQFDLPLCQGGEVLLADLAYPKDAQKSIPTPNKKIRLNRIHLEEDVAKSTHKDNASLIDFNRAGTPLMEIVSEADIETPEEAFAYLKTLQQILIYGDISDADMEKGQMRCDVNVSLRPLGQEKWGEKIELKNLNSISAVRAALHYEIERQTDELNQGIPQIQSTRRWDANLGETQLMRTKEDAHDYRYFPCPDLVPVRTAPLIAKVKGRVPELPAAKCQRFQSEFGLSAYDADVLAAERPLADYFEAAAAGAKSPKKIANWVSNQLLSKLNETNSSITDCPLPPAQIKQLVGLVEAGTVSNNQAKEVFDTLWSRPTEDPAAIAKELGYEPADTSELDSWIDAAIAENPSQVADIQAGNHKLLNFLVGQVMKKAKGKANPKLVTEGLQQKLL